MMLAKAAPSKAGAGRLVARLNPRSTRRAPAIAAFFGGAQQAVRQMSQHPQAGEATAAAGSFFKDKLRLLFAAGLGVLALNAGIKFASDWYYHKSVLDTLMHGVLPPPVASPELPRTELRQRIRELMQPAEASRFYHIVTGPPGGGKSTLLREACRELGRGVGYLDVDPAFEVDFGKDLGTAFGFRFQEHMKAINIVAKPILGTQYEDPQGQHPLSSVRSSATALHDAAVEFRHRTGRPFILVIDSSDRLARNEESQKVLAAVRAYARDWAQEGTITTIFVAHEWGTVERLTGDHPAQSRASAPLHVPDITQEESAQYLQALGVQLKMADQCAQLVGGSLLLLQRCAGMSKAGLPYTAIKQHMLELIEIAFLQAGLLDQTPQREGGLRALEALLQSKEGAISAAEWREHVPEREQQEALLSRGVVRFDGRQLTFASRLAAAFAGEELRTRLPAPVAEKHKQLVPPRWW